ncbi:galactokinase [Entomospira culicis]|uniref:Galactokinase n=1 Tax=Entomospira culicis TaxID=2719989 RepID=A0A968KUM3_9SPIO|nr:galactokinase family protein [Entomospira culicis]NIZ19060.1 galactokinase [Entomospira culicis]NIZ69275.1 galactokinase [Entomospira culicis]WDI37858.1 galactokinase family protein [Entomospira culicis]WDI39486.1 galactokinase family protein [Entomospira culicis]
MPTLQQQIQNNAFQETFNQLYRYPETAKERYLLLVHSFKEHFKTEPTALFSTPGRSELIGNHTDHQQGKVIATAIDLDMIAVVAPNQQNIIRVQTEGFNIPPLNLDNLAINPDEFGTSLALIRGICARFQQLGYAIGGFSASIQSDILEGSGLSSSAAFEVLIATILSHLYNHAMIDPITIAQISQYSENHYFNKPCGLMDQLACSVGGVIAIDFYNPKIPKVTPIPFNLAQTDYELCIINTGGSHADLTEDYRAIKDEMQAVAQFFQKERLSEVDPRHFTQNLPDLRQKVSDRSLLRTMHFFGENMRVEQSIKYLQKNNLPEFLRLFADSGASSFKYLQNIYSSKDPLHQHLALALALAEDFLSKNGIARVHGGGFAGTIQVFLKSDNLQEFKEKMDNIFGQDASIVLNIRPIGSIQLQPQDNHG